MTSPTPETWIERYRRGGEELAALLDVQLEQKQTDARNLTAFLRGETPETPDTDQENPS